MIAENLSNIKKEIPGHVKLVAVSKTKPAESIEEAYNGGQRIFGENRVNELVDKHEILPKDIEWHMIGHLQSKKVKLIAPFISLIHGVDSFKLLSEINKHASKNDRVIDCLLQFHIADEESKYGFSFEEVEELLDDPQFYALKNVRIVGLMGMATFTDDKTQISNEFNLLATYFAKLKSKQFKFADYFTEISMGMSGDYQLAIDAGSTMIRVGSAIFGSR